MWVREHARLARPKMASVHAAHDRGQHRVDGKGEGVCVCFASEYRTCFGLRKESARKGYQG
eukprot:scaffold20741_cov63-Phaeocystis_antarctica.AAC.1